MKKVLFATTALVATAGMAAAEVSFGGYGRFGLFYTENASEETKVEQRFRLTATGTTESDNGVKFEGRIRFQSDDGTTNGNNSLGVANNSAAGFAVSTGGFRLDVGNVSDVVDSGDVVNYYGTGVGLTSFIEQSNEMGLALTGFGTSDFGDTKATTIKVRYSVSDFTVSLSHTGDEADSPRENTQLGFGYNFGDYSVGLAFGDYDNSFYDFVALSFGGAIGAFGFSVLLVDTDGLNDVGVGFSVNYDVSAMTSVQFAYSGGDDDQYGVGFRHGLGGGVSLRGGIGYDDSGSGTTKADFGVLFNF